MKLPDLVKALRGGAVLHLSFVNGRNWELVTATTTIGVTGSVVKAALKRRVIIGAGDSLFADVPSQTWRYNKTDGGASWG